MREPPERIQRLPEQYFTALLARVSAAAAEEGEQFVDLGRGNPEVGPPEHVVRALVESAARPDVHGYSPFAGLPELKEPIAGIRITSPQSRSPARFTPRSTASIQLPMRCI